MHFFTQQQLAGCSGRPALGSQKGKRKEKNRHPANSRCYGIALDLLRRMAQGNMRYLSRYGKKASRQKLPSCL